MSLAFLLDTNVLAEPLKAEPDRGVMAKIRQHEGQMAVAAPVWHEMWFGWARLAAGKRRTAIEAYLSSALRPSLQILAYTAAAGEWHARERARLVARGRTPSFVDGQIASIAVEHDLTLVTRNGSDFKMFHGLRVVDWSG
ncbi:MAG: type II toxin-antitoxin system VapC family toxin [Deltaproteobacteria bacterium]|nr:type II toxin-antitoxin system VapC family toxin [Deltaproteobacteria bacterium]